MVWVVVVSMYIMVLPPYLLWGHHACLSTLCKLQVASEWPIMQRGQISLESNDHTHTHTLIDTVSPPLLPTGAAHLVAANTEDAVSSLSRSLESNTEANTREYIEHQHRVLHHELTFCVQISITLTLLHLSSLLNTHWQHKSSGRSTWCESG